MKTFILTTQHIKLLRASWVCWIDMEFGAAGIDPKRPYGNSSVVEDMLELFGEGYDPEEDMPENLHDSMVKLHAETEVALQIVLFTGKFEPGVYRQRSEYDTQAWDLVEAA